jgi:hypothetical protein
MLFTKNEKCNPKRHKLIFSVSHLATRLNCKAFQQTIRHHTRFWCQFGDDISSQRIGQLPSRSTIY